MRRTGCCVAVAIAATLGGVVHADDIDRRAVIVALDEGSHAGTLPVLMRHLENEPDDGLMLFAAARAHAMVGDLGMAEACLRRAVRAGFHDFSRMRRERDLDPIRGRQVYAALMAARDAADPILAEGRVEDFLDRFGRDAYRVDRDETLAIDYITTLDDERVETLRDTVTRQVEHLSETLFDGAPHHGILVVIPRSTDADLLLASRAAHGNYQHDQRRLVSRDTGRALSHEVAHVVHHHHMDRLGQTHPMWVQEGIATLYEAWSIEDGVARFWPNERDVAIQHLLSTDRVVTISELTTLDPSAFHVDPMTTYAQVRSFMAFVDEQVGLAEWYASYVADFETDASGLTTLERMLRRTGSDIDAAWRQWASSRPMEHVVVAQPEDIPESAPRAEAPPVVVPDPAFERAMKLYSAADYDAAAAALAVIVAEQPDRPDPRYYLALARVQQGDYDAAGKQREALRSLEPSLASLLDNLLR